MKLLLDQFEQQVDETILKRGLSYFKKGLVSDMIETGNGKYEFTVEGSDTYTVELNVKGNAVTQCSCDCPYDDTVCKHIVASLFYLQKDLFGDMTASTKKKTPKKKKELTMAEQVKAILKILPHDELKDFFSNACKKDNNLKLSFISQYIHLVCPESKDLYVKQLQALVKSYAGRYNFIDTREAKQLARKVDDLLNKASESREQGQFQQPFFIASAVLETILHALEISDDSSGSLGDKIGRAYQILDELAESELDDQQHGELFAYLLNLVQDKTYEDWPWHLNALRSAVKLVKSEPETNKILSILDQLSKNSTQWTYPRIQSIKLELIRKTEGQAAADQYLENNLSNPQFRKEAIERALKRQDYKRAERLAKEGIASDVNKFRGMAEEWRNYLLTIYQADGDTKSTISLAHHFFLNYHTRFHPKQYYYTLLKSLIEPEQWPDYVDKLAREIKKTNYLFSYQELIDLYIWEASWEKLTELLKRSSRLEEIANTLPHLPAAYINQVTPAYKQLIFLYVEQYIGRSYYQAACQHIKLLKQWDADMANQLAQELRIQFRARRALLEELDKI